MSDVCLTRKCTVFAQFGSSPYAWALAIRRFRKYCALGMSSEIIAVSSAKLTSQHMQSGGVGQSSFTKLACTSVMRTDSIIMNK